MDKNICCYCNIEIEGLEVCVGDEKWAHSACYKLHHPPALARDMFEVAQSMSDPVLAAAIIASSVPQRIADEIVNEYNKQLLRNWFYGCMQ